MEILPLENIDLHGKNYEVTAKVVGQNLDSASTEVRASVVVLDAPEFQQDMGDGYSPGSPSERAGLEKIESNHFC